MADTVPITAGSGTSIATDDIGPGVHYQRVKITQGVDGTNDGDTSATLPLPTRLYSATGAETNVAASATDVTVLAANAARRGATVFNDSTVLLYLLLAAATSSATVFTVKLSGGGYYEVPFGYAGIIHGIWESATGSARVTELT
jgi:hypothetical protein